MSQISEYMTPHENDFHDRKDLTPNVCAVFVEERYRCQGIAGRIPDYVCKDVKAQGDGEEDPSRMYVHREMDQERRPAYYRHDAAGEKIR